MAKTDDLIKALQAQVELLQRTLAANGIMPPLPQVEKAEERADYIAFGSEEHAAFLGLVEVKEGDDASQYITFASPGGGRTWRLEDEVTQFMTFPDPRQVAALVLRQKVSELEAGAPKVPDDAPPMWRPIDEPAMTPA